MAILNYAEGFIHGSRGTKKMSPGDLRRTFHRILNMEIIRLAYRSSRDRENFIFLAEKEKYPLDTLLGLGEVLRRLNTPLFGTLE